MLQLCWEVHHMTASCNGSGPSSGHRMGVNSAAHCWPARGVETALARKLLLSVRKSLVKGLLLSQPLLCFNYLFSFFLMGINTEIQSSPAEVPVLLQPLYEPHAEPALWAQALCSGEAEDGGNAAAQHVVDWGAVPEESSRRPLPVSCHTHVHLRLCLLPQKE